MNCEFASSTQISIDPIQYQYAQITCSWSETTLYIFGVIIFVAIAILILKILK